MKFTNFLSALTLLVAVVTTVAAQKKPLFDPALTDQAEQHDLKVKTPFLKKAKIEFGPYHLSDSRRGGTKLGASGWAVFDIGPERIETSQKSELSLTDGHDIIDAELLFTSKTKNLNAGSAGKFTPKDETDFYAFLYVSNDAPWQLHLHQDGLHWTPGWPEGSLRTDGKHIDIKSVTTSAGEKGLGALMVNNSGLEFREGNEVLAAVQLFEDRRVLFAQGLTEETRLAIATAVAAILYQYEVLGGISPSDAP